MTTCIERCLLGRDESVTLHTEGEGKEGDGDKEEREGTASDEN